MAAVKEEQAKAALTAAQHLSGRMVKEGLYSSLQRSKNTSKTQDGYPYIQVLIGRKKSSEDSFNHFVMGICKTIKPCQLNKVTNMSNWFTNIIVVANHDDGKFLKNYSWKRVSNLAQPKHSAKKEEKADKTSWKLVKSCRSILSPSKRISNLHFIIPIKELELNSTQNKEES